MEIEWLGGGDGDAGTSVNAYRKSSEVRGEGEERGKGVDAEEYAGLEKVEGDELGR